VTRVLRALLLVTLGAGPDPVLARLPTFVPPITLDRDHHLSAPPLSAPEATRRVLGAALDVGGDLTALGTPAAPSQAPAEASEPKLELALGGRIPLATGEVWYLLYSRVTQPTGTEEDAWLVTFDPAGVVTAGVSLGGWSSSEAGESADVITVQPDGRVVTRREATSAAPDLDEGDTVTLRSTVTVDVRHPASRAERFDSNQGRFVDERSGGVLHIVQHGRALRVYGQGTDFEASRRLAVEGDAAARAFGVRFPGAKRPSRLSFDAARASVRCLNPDGTVQTFVRAH
jgi:hypothetical protein